MLKFKDHNDVANYMIEEYRKINQANLPTVTYCGLYEDVEKILSKLVAAGYKMHCIELENPEIGSYDEEYYVSIGWDDVLFCEKAMSVSNKYLFEDSDIALVSCECNDEINEYFTGKVKHFVSIEGDSYYTKKRKACKEKIKFTMPEIDEASIDKLIDIIESLD